MKKFVSLFLSFAMLLSITAGLDFSAFADDYTEIWTADDLYLINTNLSGNYRLMTDIDLSESSYSKNWEPIGSDTTVYGDSGFTGTFDGNDYSIIGMQIKKSYTYAGLFAINNGIIRNLKLEKCSISENKKAGLLCGMNNGNILKCIVIESEVICGNISTQSTAYAGGITAFNSGNITLCTYINGKVETYSNGCERKGVSVYSGGITANNTGNIEYDSCINTKITAYIETYAYGDAAGNNYSRSGYCYAGGIVALSSTTVNYCYSISNIYIGGEDKQYWTGISGSLGNHRYYAENIKNISGVCNIGKDLEVSFENSYSAINYYFYKSGNYSKVSLSEDDGINKARLSYITNYNYGYITDASGNKKELTASQMKLQPLYLDFDFDNIWILDKGTDYPYPQLRNNRQDTEKHVESLQITLPENKEYVDTFNTDDLIVKAIYKNGNSEIISDYDISVSENEGDEKIVTVSYCGATETFNIIVHSLNSEWEITKNPDCENDGEKVLTCKYCDKVIETEIISAKGHVPIVDVEAKAPTCTKSGNTEQSHCGVCGKILNEIEVIKPTGHSYIKNVTPPTCEEQGYTTYMCTKCGDTNVGDYEFPKGHALVTVSGYPATCTTDGLSSGAYCSVCNKTVEQQKVIKATGHKWNNGVITKRATCIENGIKTYTCTVCGETRTEQIAKTGHTIVIDKGIESTCTSTGLTQGSHCSVCNTILIEQKVIDKKPHTVVIDNAVEPTCIKTGLTQGSHCSVCGEIIEQQEVINAAGHKWNSGEITKPADCTENGVKTYTCTVCGETKTEIINAKGHTSVIDEAVEPTCTSAGLTQGLHCSVCNTVLIEQKVIDKKAHTVVIDKAVEPTCTSTGLAEGSHCSVCNQILVKQEVIPEIPHNCEWINDNGHIVKKCTVCNNELLKLPFEDLYGYEYYGDYIAYTSVYNKFITGTNPPERTLFSPTTPITRAMFVTILYRMAGEPYANNNPYRTSPFTDITDTSVYYYDAACWALKNGITTETTFKPFDNVSREQTASFLFRYAKDNGKLGNSAYKNVNLAKYPDFGDVHGWAVEAMQWANYNGMITGTQQGYINPQGATQRIHATKILYGFGKVCNIGNFA